MMTTSTVAEFLDTSDNGYIPVAVVTEDGVEFATKPICLEEGTFLARSPDRKGRAIAALMATRCARQEMGHAG